MAYGKDIPTSIQPMTWYTLSAKVTGEQIGFLHISIGEPKDFSCTSRGSPSVVPKLQLAWLYIWIEVSTILGAISHIVKWKLVKLRESCAPDGRTMSDGSYAATTWEVRFELTEVSTSSPYKLRIATASSNGAAIEVTPLKLLPPETYVEPCLAY